MPRSAILSLFLAVAACDAPDAVGVVRAASALPDFMDEDGKDPLVPGCLYQYPGANSCAAEPELAVVDHCEGDNLVEAWAHRIQFAPRFAVVLCGSYECCSTGLSEPKSCDQWCSEYYGEVTTPPGEGPQYNLQGRCVSVPDHCGPGNDSGYCVCGVSFVDDDGDDPLTGGCQWKYPETLTCEDTVRFLEEIDSCKDGATLVERLTRADHEATTPCEQEECCVDTHTKEYPCGATCRAQHGEGWVGWCTQTSYECVDGLPESRPAYCACCALAGTSCSMGEDCCSGDCEDGICADE